MYDTSSIPDRLSPANVRLILEAWFDAHNLELFPWETDPKRVEVGVAAPLYSTEGQCLCGHEPHHHKIKKGCANCDCPTYQDRIIYVGKLDLFAHRRANGDPCPVDHKTTGQFGPRFLNQFRLDSQMSGYLWLASQYAKRPVRVGFINALELSIVPTSEKKCAKHGVPFSECGPFEHTRDKWQVLGPIERSDDQIEDWRESAIDLALKYRRLLALTSHYDAPVEGMFANGCGWCEFREWCEAGRPKKQIASMFAIHEWKPWGHAFTDSAGIEKGKPFTPVPTSFYVDNSILKAVASCSTQALMRYGRGHTSHQQTGPLAAGTAVHAALEIWFKGGSAKKALKTFDAIYRPQGA